MSIRWRWIALAIVVCLIAAGAAAVAIAGGGSGVGATGTVDPGGVNGPGGGAPRSASRTSHRPSPSRTSHRPSGAPYPPYKHIVPAKMLDARDCTFAPTSEFYPVKNGWIAENHRRSTVVCAGGASYEGPSDGLFLIIRWNDVRSNQKISKVKVAASGPVKITKAPLGAKVVTSAQDHGDFEFSGSKGVTGTLHLADDTVSLNP